MSKNISYKIIRVKEGNYDKIIDFVMGLGQFHFGKVKVIKRC
jgi:hypothetical protein